MRPNTWIFGFSLFVLVLFLGIGVSDYLSESHVDMYDDGTLVAQTDAFDNYGIGGLNVTSTYASGVVKYGFDLREDYTFRLTQTTLVNGTLTNPTVTTGTFSTSTLTNPVINGTITTTGLTLPAVTLGGNVASNGKSFTGTIANLGTVTTADINGGTIDGVNIGASSPATITSPTMAGVMTSASALSMTAAAGSEVVINDSSADVDTRIETDGNANTVFIRGSDDRIGFGTSTLMSTTLTVDGGMYVRNTGPVLTSVRTGLTVDNDEATSLMLRARKSTSMNDGFGSAAYWSIGDDTATATAAYISGTRDGADTTGRMTLGVYIAGVRTALFALKGSTGFPTSLVKFVCDAGADITGLLALIRTSTSTGDDASGILSKFVKATDMADGFGGSWYFQIQDDAAVANTIAYLAASRDGADNTGALSFGTYATGSRTERMRIMGDGNVSIGGNTTKPATGAKALIMADGTALSGMPSNTAGFYADNVGTTTEMFVIDEGGHSTQISPHDTDTGHWIYSSSNTYTGETLFIDLEAMIADIETLTGKTYMIREQLPANEKRDWWQDQDRLYREAEQARIDIMVDAVVTGKRTEDVIMPDKYTCQAPPEWMTAKGIATEPEIGYCGRTK